MIYLQIGVSRAMSALRPFTMEKQLKSVPPVGINPGMTMFFIYRLKSYVETRSNAYL